MSLRNIKPQIQNISQNSFYNLATLTSLHTGPPAASFNCGLPDGSNSRVILSRRSGSVTVTVPRTVSTFVPSGTESSEEPEGDNNSRELGRSFVSVTSITNSFQI